MIVIATYDVTHDDRRSKLAALLQSLGDRVQKSVFILTIDDKQLSDLADRSSEILDLDADSFYIFRQCAACWEGLQCHGQAHAPTQVLHWAVM